MGLGAGHDGHLRLSFGVRLASYNRRRAVPDREVRRVPTDRPARRAPRQARHARPRSRSSTRARRSATTRRRRSRRPRARWPASATCRTGCGPRPSTPCWSSSRASTPPARTARSPRSWRPSTRRAARSRSFKVPSAEELAHDFLWRIHKRTPGKGEVGIFNRSHYEDVLVVRVHDLVPKRVWSKRYDQINDFERMLADERHHDRQVLPDDRPRRAAQALPGALRRPEEALEVQARRPRGAEALGRLPGRLRRGALEDVDRLGAVVRHPRQPELVPQPRGVDHPGRHDGGLKPAYPAPPDLPPNLVIE